jgi:hypothetical protein
MIKKGVYDGGHQILILGDPLSDQILPQKYFKCGEMKKTIHFHECSLASFSYLAHEFVYM